MRKTERYYKVSILWFRQPDIFRLIKEKRFGVTILGICAVMIFSTGVSEISSQVDFIAVDIVIDDFIYCGWGRYLVMICAAIPFSCSYYDDVRNNYYDIMILKMGKHKYAWSKIKCNFGATFFTSFGGIILFIVVVSFRFQWSYYETFHEMTYASPYAEWIVMGHVTQFIIIRSILFSMAASVWSMLALLVSTWDTNRLTILSVPFFAAYIDERFSTFSFSWTGVSNCSDGTIPIVGSLWANVAYSICYMLFLIVIMGYFFEGRLGKEETNERY